MFQQVFQSRLMLHSILRQRPRMRGRCLAGMYDLRLVSVMRRPLVAGRQGNLLFLQQHPLCAIWRKPW